MELRIEIAALRDHPPPQSCQIVTDSPHPHLPMVPVLVHWATATASARVTRLPVTETTTFITYCVQSPDGRLPQRIQIVAMACGVSFSMPRRALFMLKRY